ncbi:hypothetical protein [Sulfitobacter pontiacus]|uniref:hypothetical protein n=1 Tax=Sulfitobacter pontiacus TaxID=60137 RepID=UPI0030EE705F
MNTSTRLKKLEGRMATLTVFIPELTITKSEGSETATYTCGDYSYSENRQLDDDAANFLAAFEAKGLVGAQDAYPGAIVLPLDVRDL